MPFTIPLRDDLPFFDLHVSLDDATYTLQLRWNVREGAWFMDVLDQQGEALLLAGLRLVASFPLTAYVTDRKPPGDLVVIDTTGAGADPGRADLGTRHALVYFTAAELAA